MCVVYNQEGGDEQEFEIQLVQQQQWLVVCILWVVNWMEFQI